MLLYWNIRVICLPLSLSPSLSFLTHFLFLEQHHHHVGPSSQMEKVGKLKTESTRRWLKQCILLSAKSTFPHIIVSFVQSLYDIYDQKLFLFLKTSLVSLTKKLSEDLTGHNSIYLTCYKSVKDGVLFSLVLSPPQVHNHNYNGEVPMYTVHTAGRCQSAKV